MLNSIRIPCNMKVLPLYCVCKYHWRKYPDSEVHMAHMGPTWVLSGPSGPHVGPMNLAIRVLLYLLTLCLLLIKISRQYEGNTRYIVSTNSIEGSIFLSANFMPFALSPFLSAWVVLCGNDGDYLLIHFCRSVVLVCRIFLFACSRPRYWLHRLEQRQRVSLYSVSMWVLLEIWEKLKVNEYSLLWDSLLRLTDCVLHSDWLITHFDADSLVPTQTPSHLQQGWWIWCYIEI